MGAVVDYAMPVIALEYKGVPIWDGISSQVISLTFQDHYEGKSDEIQLDLENSHQRWFDQWFPEHGDDMRGVIGYADGPKIDMGKFSLDQPNAKGGRGGDTFSIRGQSLQVKKAQKTKKSKAFEKQSLKQIVQKVADEHGYELKGEVPDVDFERISQRRETDLEFLSRLADEYGAFFSVKYDKLVFDERDKAFSRKKVRTIHKGERALITYDFKHDAAKTYSKAKLTYFDGHEKKKIEGEAEDKQVKTGDTLKLDDRAENAGQAKKKAKAALQKKNMAQWSGSLSLVGDPTLRAGTIITVRGFGKYNRKYMVMSSRHHINRSGYTTTVELKDARSIAAK